MDDAAGQNVASDDPFHLIWQKSPLCPSPSLGRVVRLSTTAIGRFLALGGVESQRGSGNWSLLLARAMSELVDLQFRRRDFQNREEERKLATEALFPSVSKAPSCRCSKSGRSKGMLRMRCGRVPARQEHRCECPRFQCPSLRTGYLGAKWLATSSCWQMSLFVVAPLFVKYLSTKTHDGPASEVEKVVAALPGVVGLRRHRPNSPKPQNQASIACSACREGRPARLVGRS
jgi:hypothetical protein